MNALYAAGAYMLSTLIPTAQAQLELSCPPARLQNALNKIAEINSQFPQNREVGLLFYEKAQWYQIVEKCFRIPIVPSKQGEFSLPAELFERFAFKIWNGPFKLKYIAHVAEADNFVAQEATKEVAKRAGEAAVKGGTQSWLLRPITYAVDLVGTRAAIAICVTGAALSGFGIYKYWCANKQKAS